MQIFQSVALLLVFSLNSVLGGTEAILLCLHEEGAAHWKVSELESSGLLGEDHAHEENASEDCEVSTSSCLDIVLSSFDFAATPIERLLSATPKEWVLPNRLFVEAKWDVNRARVLMLAESRAFEATLQSGATAQVVQSVQLRL